jgi:hypothetical protein
MSPTTMALMMSPSTLSPSDEVRPRLCSPPQHFPHLTTSPGAPRCYDA